MHLNRFIELWCEVVCQLFIKYVWLSFMGNVRKLAKMSTGLCLCNALLKLSFIVYRHVKNRNYCTIFQGPFFIWAHCDSDDLLFSILRNVNIFWQGLTICYSYDQRNNSLVLIWSQAQIISYFPVICDFWCSSSSVIRAMYWHGVFFPSHWNIKVSDSITARTRQLFWRLNTTYH